MSDYADLKARVSKFADGNAWPSTVQLIVDLAAAIDALERERDEAEARAKRLEKAWERVAIGGNHLATWLPEPCPPVETEPLVALEQIGAGIHYDVWCCWRAIMQSRAALQEDKSHD